MFWPSSTTSFWPARLADDGAGQVHDGGAGVPGPGLKRGGEGERAAVKHLLAALTGHQRVKGGEGPSLAGEGKDVGGAASLASTLVRL